MTQKSIKYGEGIGVNDPDALIDYFYGRENSSAKEILTEHSRAVANFALDINDKRNLGLGRSEIMAAAMLHDIGIIRTHAPGIGCDGNEPYIRHGVAGADMLRSIGVDEWLARIAERHTGAGLTVEEIMKENLPLPADRILYPVTLLEKLICYADKFFSKRPGSLNMPKPVEKIFAEMESLGKESAERFARLHSLFAD